MQSTKTIYADYQATTPADPRVVEKMAPYWSELFGNPHSSDHIVGWEADKALHDAAASVARLIGADADEVVFTSGATEANNLALIGLARNASTERRRILLGATEHKCVLGAARFLSQYEGFTVETIPVDNKGYINLDALQSSLKSDILIVSIMAVNNEIGTIQDIPKIAELLEPHGILFHCDAAQAPCATDDVYDLSKYAHLISLSGHKMYGPQGIGALYINRNLHAQIEPIIHGGNQQGGLRSGTVPVPLSVGMAAAAEILTMHEEAAVEQRRVGLLRDHFVCLLHDSEFPVVVNGPPGPAFAGRHPGNANICFDGFNAQDILGALQPRLAASTGAACSSGIPEPSHVLAALGMAPAECNASIRFSFGRFNSREDAEAAAHLVIEALAALSS